MNNEVHYATPYFIKNKEYLTIHFKTMSVILRKKNLLKT